eukprot:g26994.t1
MGCTSTKPAEAPEKSNDKGKETASTAMGRAQFIIDNPGKLLDFYDLDKKKLGEGSYGYVCKGKNKATNAIRAVKTIAKGKMKNIERFKQEIAIMKMMDRLRPWRMVRGMCRESCEQFQQRERFW